MARPANLYPGAGVIVPGPLLIAVRLHGKTSKIGDIAGTNLNFAEQHDRIEKLIFWREELLAAQELDRPTRSAFVVFSADEAYLVDNVLPPDGQTVTAEVTRLDPEDYADKLPPGAP